MSSMFSLRERLTEKLALDFSEYSAQSGLYARFIPTAGKEKNALTNLIRTSDPPFEPDEWALNPHLTLMWSRQQVARKQIEAVLDARPHQAAVTGVSYWPGRAGIGFIVFNVQCPEIIAAHEMLEKLGACHSYDRFEPHMTIATDVGAINSEIRNWLGVMNERLWLKPMTCRLSSLSFSDLY